MLRPTKNEIEAVADLLASGAESPEALAFEVIKLVEQLREQRANWAVIYELSPGVYVGYNGHATRGAAEKSIAKNPMAQVSRRGAIVPVYGESVALAGLEKADGPPTARGDWAVVREDQRAFARGWKGREVEKKNFL